MAQLFNQILGNPSGLLGGIVFRIRKGAIFMASRPSKRGSLPSVEEEAFRAKFALTGKIAHGINSISVLKDAWPKGIGRMSKFNEIFKANYDLVNSAANLGSVTVAPVFGFNLTNPVLTAGASGVHFVADALGVNVGIDTGIEKYVMSAGIVVLLNPTSESIPKTNVLAFKSIQHNLDLINEIDHTIDFSANLLSIYGSYTDRKVFACLVTLDDNSKVIRYSITAHSI
jgi:hypothetical protein